MVTDCVWRGRAGCVSPYKHSKKCSSDCPSYKSVYYAGVHGMKRRGGKEAIPTLAAMKSLEDFIKEAIKDEKEAQRYYTKTLMFINKNIPKDTMIRTLKLSYGADSHTIVQVLDKILKDEMKHEYFLNKVMSIIRSDQIPLGGKKIKRKKKPSFWNRLW